jgi:hypothetical protein
MRCIVGVVLFLVLYFGGCAVLGAVAGGIAGANDPRHARSVGRVAGANAVTKYHALVAVGAGTVSLLCCCLPTLLVKMNERNQWRQYAEELERSSRAR